MPAQPAEPWDVLYYRTADGEIPVDAFLDACPVKVRARLMAVLDDVAAAPPPSYSGGGRWEVMRDAMAGFYEVRIKGPGRELFRLYCILENGAKDHLTARGLPRPAVVATAGLRKPPETAIRAADYARVRAMGNDYVTTTPRRIAQPPAT